MPTEPFSLAAAPEPGNYTTPLSDTSVPVVTLRNPEALELPEYGTVTFRYRRGPRSVSESRSGPGRVEVPIELLEVLESCACEAPDDEDQESPGEAEDAVDRLFNALNAQEEVEG